ncbi:MAG: Polysaccharide export protein [uncultured bacterium]|nr:MAG: Polysaccharide export protein [uncultured bacterium]HBH18209.1 hypothetical protein [Cyanobacteria bacterium UBA9579]
MGKSKVTMALLLLTLMLNSNCANSEELSSVPDEKSNEAELNQVLDLEEFKQQLQEISTVAPAASSNQLNGRVKTLSTKYLLSPGDSIAVSVYGEPEFSQASVLVRPDGYATIEPFGEMYVAGSDVNDLTTELKARFKSYLLDPKISVKVNSMHTAKVYIYGAVQKPGLYQQERVTARDGSTGTTAIVTPELTVASVISNAGGIKYNADLRQVKVTNNATGRNEVLDLMNLIENGDASQDIYLRSGDTVYIPTLESNAQIADRDFMLVASSSLAPADFPVRVIGAVNRPGIHKLTSGSPRLNSAIAASEGYMPEANQKVVTIQRVTPQGNVSTFYVDPNKNDLILRPNDIVVVADKSTSVASRGFDFAGTIITPFGRFADSFNSWAEMFNPSRRYRRW